MSTTLRTLSPVIGILLSLLVHAQASGIRGILYSFETLPNNRSAHTQSVGLGYDHDLEQRLSFNVNFRTDLEGQVWTAEYRSAYHFSDNSSTSFYVGPSIAYRNISGTGSGVVPVGLRMGIRGGLDGFFADLYAGFAHNMGGKDLGKLNDRTNKRSPIGTTFVFGLDLGLGWDH